MAITAAQVKELREKTGAGIMDAFKNQLGVASSLKTKLLGSQAPPCQSSRIV